MANYYFNCVELSSICLSGTGKVVYNILHPEINHIVTVETDILRIYWWAYNPGLASTYWVVYRGHCYTLFIYKLNYNSEATREHIYLI